MGTIRKTCLALIAIAVSLLFAACVKSYNGGIGSYQGGIYNNAVVGNTDSILENPFIKTLDSATSTFSIDADGGSYALARKLINASPSSINAYKDAIRTEEFINYFTYNYPNASNNENIAVNGEVSTCPWNGDNKLIRIGVKGQSVAANNYPYANFVLLIDVSGSMSDPDKLKLLKEGFSMFAEQMRPQDRIAIVTYAGSDKVALASTPGTQKKTSSMPFHILDQAVAQMEQPGSKRLMRSLKVISLREGITGSSLALTAILMWA